MGWGKGASQSKTAETTRPGSTRFETDRSTATIKEREDLERALRTADTAHSAEERKEIRKQSIARYNSTSACDTDLRKTAASSSDRSTKTVGWASAPSASIPQRIIPSVIPASSKEYKPKGVLKSASMSNRLSTAQKVGYTALAAICALGALYYYTRGSSAAASDAPYDSLPDLSDYQSGANYAFTPSASDLPDAHSGLDTDYGSHSYGGGYDWGQGTEGHWTS